MGVTVRFSGPVRPPAYPEPQPVHFSAYSNGLEGLFVQGLAEYDPGSGLCGVKPVVTLLKVTVGMPTMSNASA
jgi:hypothetical protein